METLRSGCIVWKGSYSGTDDFAVVCYFGCILWTWSRNCENVHIFYFQSLSLFLQSMIPESIILPYSSYYPIPFIAVSTLYLFPKASRSISSLISPWQIFLLSLLSTTAFSMLFGYLAFHQQFSFIDPIVACLLLYGTIFLVFNLVNLDLS